MARLGRIVVPGYPHHVTQRGNCHQTVFFDPSVYALYRAPACRALPQGFRRGLGVLPDAEPRPSRAHAANGRRPRAPSTRHTGSTPASSMRARLDWSPVPGSVLFVALDEGAFDGCRAPRGAQSGAGAVG